MTLDKQKVTVAVVGGYSPNWEERKESLPLPQLPVDYVEAGRAIGCALAEAGHPVVLCVPDWTKPRLGDAVLEGITKARLAPDQSAHAVTVYVTAGIPQEDNKNTLAEAWRGVEPPNVSLTWKPLAEDPVYESISFPTVRSIDAMILLSGDRLSEIVASAAHYVRNEPVVTITRFGGAGKVLYRDVFRSHYQSFAEEDDRIRSLLGVLDDTWDTAPSQGNQARAVKVVELTERLYRANELRKKENLNWRSIAYLCLGLFVLWAFFFTLLSVAGSLAGNAAATPAGGEAALTPVGAIPKADGAAPASLSKLLVGWDNLFQNGLLWFELMIAATLGSLLRKVAAFHFGDVVVLDRSAFITDVAAGIVLAMAFGLLYFAAGWSFNGEAVFPPLGSTTPTLVAALSVGGLAAGLLLPVEELGERLKQFVAPGEATETK